MTLETKVYYLEELLKKISPLKKKGLIINICDIFDFNIVDIEFLLVFRYRVVSPILEEFINRAIEFILSNEEYFIEEAREEL